MASPIGNSQNSISHSRSVYLAFTFNYFSETTIVTEGIERQRTWSSANGEL